MKRILFVDDESVLLEAFQADFVERWDGWQCDVADSGHGALRWLRGHSADVVIADLHMPGMSGAALLAAVMDRYPLTTRIIQASHADRATCLEMLGVAHQFLLKPIDCGALAETVERADFQRRLLESRSLRAVVNRLQAIPSIPGLYLELIQALRAEEPSVNEIADIVGRDLGMCSKLLQVVNSAFFGLPRQVLDVAEAVQFLGVDMIKALVLQLHIIAFFAQQPLRDFDFELLWKHSWRTGTRAKEAAEMGGLTEAQVNDAFCAGLLHDVGKLVLATVVPGQFSNAIELSKLKKIPLFEAERAVFGTSHAEVGACLLGLWGLPVPLLQAVAHHHAQFPDADSSSGLESEGVLAPLVRQANLLAHSDPEFSAR